MIISVKKAYFSHFTSLHKCYWFSKDLCWLVMWELCFVDWNNHLVPVLFKPLSFLVWFSNLSTAKLLYHALWRVAEGSGEWAEGYLALRNVMGMAYCTLLWFVARINKQAAACTCNEMANASVPIRCKLCNLQLAEFRQRWRLFGERTIHVVPTAIWLLRACIPGSALSVSDAEDILRAPVADDDPVVYLCKSPCYTRLDRIQKLESELKVLKEEMKD